MKKSEKIIAVIVALVFIGFGIYMTFYDGNVSKYDSKTNAYKVDVNEYYDSDSGTMYKPTFYFRVHGKEYVCDSKLSSSSYPNADNNVVYYHCSQGKDRVGVASYLIESALGVSEEDKVEDYLLSNVAMEKRRDRLIESVKNRPFYNEQYKKDLLEVFSAKIEYLEKAIETINSKYGGPIPYLENVLKVDVNKFREMFLE